MDFIGQIKLRKVKTMSKTNINIGGGFTSLLTILFIALKLLDKIDWSWYWVLSPLWIPILVVIGILLIILIFITIMALIKEIIGRW